MILFKSIFCQVNFDLIWSYFFSMQYFDYIIKIKFRLKIIFSRRFYIRLHNLFRYMYHASQNWCHSLVTRISQLDSGREKSLRTYRRQDTWSSSTINQHRWPSFVFLYCEMRTEWPANSSLGELTLLREVPRGGRSEGSSRVVVDAIAAIPSRTSLIISRLSSSIILDPAKWLSFVAACLRTSFKESKTRQETDFSNLSQDFKNFELCILHIYLFAWLTSLQNYLHLLKLN